MASSTADLAAMAKGLSTYYDLGMDADRIAELCIAIEPTDNIMYPELNLFNHVDGRVLMDYKCHLTTPVLIIEFTGRVNTMGLHDQLEKSSTRDTRAFDEVIHRFKEGLIANDLDIIGSACTESARLNQKIIYKPHLETLIRLAHDFGGYGVVTGHSGTVIGVMYDNQKFDYQGFMQAFLKSVPKEDYDALFLKNIIAGGLETRIIEK